MTSIEEHKKKIKEHLKEIDEAINEGIEKKPVSVGFHCSACSLQLLELYLHLENKVPLTKILKHDWFKRPHPNQKIPVLIERKLPIEFPNKENIYELIYKIEEKRNSLMYGKSSEEQIKEVIEDFIKLRKIFKEVIKDEELKL